MSLLLSGQALEKIIQSVSAEKISLSLWIKGLWQGSRTRCAYLSGTTGVPAYYLSPSPAHHSPGLQARLCGPHWEQGTEKCLLEGRNITVSNHHYSFIVLLVISLQLSSDNSPVEIHKFTNLFNTTYFYFLPNAFSLFKDCTWLGPFRHLGVAGRKRDKGQIKS